jgi:ribosomal protein S18 acetylase RimI-like enzyme
METGKETDQSIRIRGAFPDDLPFLRSMALEAFSIYGDYETILTDFFVSKGVYTYVAEEIRTALALPVGLLMMAIRNPKRREPYFAEILAIAVDQEYRNGGVGSRLIEFAKRWPLFFCEEISVPEVHLSVAESNVRGRAFFERHGFEMFQEEPWNYPAGQKAFRMRYAVNAGERGDAPPSLANFTETI